MGLLQGVHPRPAADRQHVGAVRAQLARCRPAGRRHPGRRAERDRGDACRPTRPSPCTMRPTTARSAAARPTASAAAQPVAAQRDRSAGRRDVEPSRLPGAPAYYEVGLPTGAYAGQAPRGAMLVIHGGGWMHDRDRRGADQPHRGRPLACARLRDRQPHLPRLRRVVHRRGVVLRQGPRALRRRGEDLRHRHLGRRAPRAAARRHATGRLLRRQHRGADRPAHDPVPARLRRRHRHPGLDARPALGAQPRRRRVRGGEPRLAQPGGLGRGTDREHPPAAGLLRRRRDRPVGAGHRPARRHARRQPGGLRRHRAARAGHHRRVRARAHDAGRARRLLRARGAARVADPRLDDPARTCADRRCRRASATAACRARRRGRRATPSARSGRRGSSTGGRPPSAAPAGCRAASR